MTLTVVDVYYYWHGSYEHDFSQISGVSENGTQTLKVDGTNFSNNSDLQISRGRT